MNSDLPLPNTRTHAGDDSEGQILGIHFKNFLYIAVALLLSTILLLVIYRKNEGNIQQALLTGMLPLSFALVHVFAFRQGRPSAYDRDLVETMLTGKAWQPSFKPKSRPLLSNDL